jgi:hypothetical protein
VQPVGGWKALLETLILRVMMMNFLTAKVKFYNVIVTLLSTEKIKYYMLVLIDIILIAKIITYIGKQM